MTGRILYFKRSEEPELIRLTHDTLFGPEHVSDDELVAFVFDDLPGPRRDFVSDHLDACERCQADLLELRKVHRELGTPSIRQRLAARPELKGSYPIHFRRLGKLRIAAALAVALGAGAVLSRLGPAPMSQPNVQAAASIGFQQRAPELSADDRPPLSAKAHWFAEDALPAPAAIAMPVPETVSMASKPAKGRRTGATSPGHEKRPSAPPKRPSTKPKKNKPAEKAGSDRHSESNRSGSLSISCRDTPCGGTPFSFV